MIKPHEQYLKLHKEELARRKTCRGLFQAHVEGDIEDQIKSATNGNYVPGNPLFQGKIEEMPGRRVTKGRAGRPKLSRVIKT